MRSVRCFSKWILVAEGKLSVLRYVVVESDEEVQDFVLENIWDGSRVRHDTLHLPQMTALQIYFADDRSQCRLQQSDDLLSWVLIVRYHNTFAFAALAASLNQTL